MKTLSIALSLFAVTVTIVAITFTRSSTEPDTDKLSVVASFYPVYFLADRIGGDLATVSNITPADAEPHDYEPTALQMALIEQSDMLVLIGHMEPWGDNILQNLDSSETTIITTSEGLETRTMSENGETLVDPHVWLSPRLMKDMADKVSEGFKQKDPANSSIYTSRAEVLKSELQTLDAEFRSGLSSCKKREIVTSHAAFAYLAAEYELEQIPIAGLSPEVEPSVRDIADIADFARENDIRFIFFETLLSPKISQTIATEIGAETLVLNPIEGMTSEDQRQGKDYFSQMRENLANLRIALECK